MKTTKEKKLKEPKDMDVILVKYLGHGTSRHSRIRMTSTKYNLTKIIHSESGVYNSNITATKYLSALGHRIIGQFDGGIIVKVEKIVLPFEWIN